MWADVQGPLPLHGVRLRRCFSVKRRRPRPCQVYKQCLHFHEVTNNIDSLIHKSLEVFTAQHIVCKCGALYGHCVRWYVGVYPLHSWGLYKYVDLLWNLFHHLTPFRQNSEYVVPFAIYARSNINRRSYSNIISDDLDRRLKVISAFIIYLPRNRYTKVYTEYKMGRTERQQKLLL